MKIKAPITSDLFPARRNYKAELEEVSARALPFVSKQDRSKPGKKYWDVKPINDYSLACNIGAEYAAHFVQYLKNNPNDVEINLLGSIVEDMDFTDDSGAKGYHVGFFTYLEFLLYKSVKKRKVFHDLDKHRDKYRLEE